MSKLVVYFSYGGATEAKAKKLASELGAETFELKPAVPYSADDVNWQNPASRNVKEHEDPTCRPAIEAMPDLKDVDELWIGYPIWWYTHPRIINTFFDKADLNGKTVHLFATSGGSGIEDSVRELLDAYPDAGITDGTRF